LAVSASDWRFQIIIQFAELEARRCAAVL